jgi:hypothetical protein
VSETTCRWDGEEGAYVTPDGETCDTAKAQHCTARKTCSQHLAWGELTCGRCVGRVRRDIKRIAEVSPLLITVALETRRIDSEAAALAGPACDVEAWSWRKVAAMQGVAWHQSQVEEDDDWHPYTILTRWAHMLAEDYSTDEPEQWTITNAAAYLDRILHRVAHDEGQDFRLLRYEINQCRNRLEGPTVLKVRHIPERGASCPTCKAENPKLVEQLVREYSHWCDDEDCTKIHTIGDELDVWRCPRNAEHWWNPQGYANLLKERKEHSECA